MTFINCRISTNHWVTALYGLNGLSMHNLIAPTQDVFIIHSELFGIALWLFAICVWLCLVLCIVLSTEQWSNNLAPQASCSSVFANNNCEGKSFSPINNTLTSHKQPLCHRYSKYYVIETLWHATLQNSWETAPQWIRGLLQDKNTLWTHIFTPLM